MKASYFLLLCLLSFSASAEKNDYYKDLSHQAILDVINFYVVFDGCLNKSLGGRVCAGVHDAPSKEYKKNISIVKDQMIRDYETIFSAKYRLESTDRMNISDLRSKYFLSFYQLQGKLLTFLAFSQKNCSNNEESYRLLKDLIVTMRELFLGRLVLVDDRNDEVFNLDYFEKYEDSLDKRMLVGMCDYYTETNYFIRKNVYGVFAEEEKLKWSNDLLIGYYISALMPVIKQ